MKIFYEFFKNPFEKADTLLIQAESNELEAALDLNVQLERKCEQFEKDEKVIKSQLTDVKLDLEAQKSINNELHAKYG